jgi:hypothetical protein
VAVLLEPLIGDSGGRPPSGRVAGDRSEEVLTRECEHGRWRGGRDGGRARHAVEQGDLANAVAADVGGDWAPPMVTWSRPSAMA